MGAIETVSVVLTDLVGSTELEMRVSPQRMDELRREHFSLVGLEVDEHGGRMVKTTGDGVMAVFDSAAEAVSCAVGVQQRLERRNRKADEPLQVRVGLSIGDVTREDGDYYGRSVIQATRLCDRAAGGQILTDELMAEFVGPRPGVEFHPVGQLELKGFPRPVPAVEIRWEPGVEDPGIPLPPGVREHPLEGFVGRDRELEILTGLLQEAQDGERRVGLIAGEPGIGKTRLAACVASAARGAGAIALFGRCDPELAIPYGPWIQALSHYVEHAPERVLREHIKHNGGDLARLIPGLTIRVRDLPAPREADPETERYLVWSAVVKLLRYASEDAPIVVILDDLHWADKPSLLLLKHFLLHGEQAKVLLLGTYRRSDLAASHSLADLLADLRREPGVRRLALDGLSEPEIAEMIAAAAGEPLGEEGRGLSRELSRETDGNPYYVAELLRHLAESGAVQQESGHWSLRSELSDLELPQSIREVVVKRVERLGPPVHDALATAAVIGREFHIAVLASVLDRDEDELLAALEQAVGAVLLFEVQGAAGRFGFVHAVVHHTLYQQLGATRRSRLHLRLARMLEEPVPGAACARPAELARHWSLTGAREYVPEAIHYARLAGEEALAELAPDEGLRWFTQALELQSEHPVEEVERCDLLIGLGEAQRQTGHPDFRQTLLEASQLAHELRDAERAARAILANNRGTVSVTGKIDEDRIRAIERALELDDPPDPIRRARLLGLEALELGYEHRPERRRALADEALALARPVADPRTLGEVVRNALYAYWSSDALEIRLGLSDELLAAAEAAGDPALVFWAARAEMHARIEAGELERARVARDRMQGVADRLHLPTLRWISGFTAAGWWVLYGELGRAEEEAARGLQIGTEAGEPDAMTIYGGQLAVIRTHQGRAAEVIDMVAQGVAETPAIPWLAALAWGNAWAGREPEALALVQRGAEDRFESINWDMIRKSGLAMYADAATECGATEAARILYELIEPWADELIWDTAVCHGLGRTFLGLLATTLGWDERADEHFELACRFHAENDLPHWSIARGQVAWAQSLADRGDLPTAHAQAAQALALSTAHGYAIVEKRARLLLETAAAV
jgi:class 3 adenylate cyclase